MTLLNDILEWTETLPDWQRDAIRRLLLNESGLSDLDYSELYILLKKENGIETKASITACPLAAEHIPAQLATGETVVLLALRKLENVNRIASDQTLKFSENGITVIFGGNASGKSGYARVMKKACRARDQSEPIHPNANDPKATDRVPSAIFDISVAGSPEEISWSQDSIAPDRLSAISVFDARCARSYVTAEKDVAYLPYRLDILENLADQVLPKLRKMLETEIAGIEVDKLPIEHLLGNTEVGKLIEELSHNSDPEAITALGTLSNVENKRLGDLKRALNEADPLAKANEFRQSAIRLKTYGEKVDKPLVCVSPESVHQLQEHVEARAVAQSAEAEAARALRAGEELLPGTGEQVWNLLFEAARRYSTEVAYPEEDFPPSDVGKVCPLCQEALEESGTKRLKRFDDYIWNDLTRTASDARKNVDTARENIRRIDLQIGADEALRDELNALDTDLLERIETYQTCLESRRDAMLNCIESSSWANIPPLLESPRTRIRQLAAQRLRSYRSLVRFADEHTRQELQKERNQLVAKKNLANSLNVVLELLRRMKYKAALEKCLQSTRTRPISDQSKEFVSSAVTEELKKALDQEFESLGIGHIRTKLKERSERGRVLHQLLLDLPTTQKVDEILSEGEQRVFALGSFLAELALANHPSGIVFDDPVSSLDHWRRKDVARRLVREAKIRQVIVFTHDTSFLGELCEEIEVEGIQSVKMFLEWREDIPGCVSDGLPWEHQSYKARIDAHEKVQRCLSKSWPHYPGEAKASQMREEYNKLRATLERVIQDVVFNGVVKRYRDWIKVDRLSDVVGFRDSEFQDIKKLHKRCCDVVSSHDPVSAKATSVPSAIDLGHDIATLKDIITKIKDRRRQVKRTI